MAATTNPVIGGVVSTEGDHIVTTSPKVMVNGDVLFTAVGDCQVISLWSECISNNDATASTLQYSITPTVGAATAISGASASLANATAGTTAVLVGDAFATAPLLTASGVSLNTTARGTLFRSGTLTTVIGVGSTTGTWRHYLRYEPLEAGAYITAGF